MMQMFKGINLTHKLISLSWYLLCLCWPLSAAAQNTDATKLTVAYLYQMSKFTKWQQEAFSDDNAKLEICYVGQQTPTLEALLNKLASRKSNGREIATHHFADGQIILKQKQACQLIYFSEQTWLELSYEQQAAITKQRLTIGDSKAFLKQGGMLALIPVKSKLAIFVNPKAVEQSQIQLEARLLALAKKVTQ
ncbi:YfiR family protein [Catenovulum sp. SM1970]|uniref:YfiR family protein n=1 Tax=Marinifaba aquimaris TaxID=2741323 RepID=UPI0015735872|nr:YfiR family protein [Marinifaba aquimaris]NTS78525.1 YfiR family protein [Marinifaba aquimaris]